MTSQPLSSRAVLDAWTRALKLTAGIEQKPQRLLCDLIAEAADADGDAPALIATDGALSYRGLVLRINRYSRWALAQNIQKGDVVGLLMPNQPDYLAIWLGITQVGGVVALLNDQLAGTALAHGLRIVAPSHVIASADLIPAALECRTRGHLNFTLWAHGGPADAADAAIEPAVAALSGAPLSAGERRAVEVSDRALCIYTSGTTGLPKAANVSHRRILTWSLWFAGLMDVAPGDRMYNCLPMHHSVGGIVAIGPLLVRGGSVVLRTKFSARAFWDDIVRSHCTLFQYIGELARYLINTPPCPAETQHRLRICCGNGLRADVWETFQARFKIPGILEFYAASEGSFSLVNVEGKPGAIGRVPPFLSHRFPAEIVRFDAERELPFRDISGFCVRCDADEPGEAIGKLDASGGIARFEGYANAEDTEQKILRDVFVAGDAWFRTGDLMRRDAANFFYFVDRIGDTFRWKGENVSTTEVADVLTGCPGVAHAAVYGVSVPGADGRAGMASLVVADGFDLPRLAAVINSRLPAFARPLFLRLRDSIDITATFKPQKRELQMAGFDPSNGSDPIYVYNRRLSAYETLDQAMFDRIQRGEMAL
jgi:fatty-acyl-CoA synthase